MEKPTLHPMEELLLFCADRLGAQYKGLPEYDLFAAKIAAAREHATGDAAPGDEHEESKPTPTEETKTAVDTRPLEPNGQK